MHTVLVEVVVLFNYRPTVGTSRSGPPACFASGHCTVLLTGLTLANKRSQYGVLNIMLQVHFAGKGLDRSN